LIVDLVRNNSCRQFPLWTGDQLQQNILVFFPVGTFYEFYNGHAEIAHQILGLKLMSGMRGFFCGCGFHRHLLSHYLAKARQYGFYVALLGLDGQKSGHVGRRRLVRLRSCH
jgi:DNA mismatch repair ATPase MutS